MSSNPEITVVVSTYNRGEMLRATLESLAGQDSGGVSYEVIVVDNNSKDETSRVIKEFIASSPVEMKYVFEPRQGVSYGRNAGIERARGAIIAFTDDDVRPLADWIAQIKRAFDLFPLVDYIGGKVLPKWNMPPPLWLKHEHWAPLALVDYGDEPFYTSAQRPVNFPTANLAVRREAFERAGLFSPDFPRSQDREFQLRLLQAGRLGLYAPAIRVIADVQNERLEKRYHHKWYRVTGRFHSDMRLCDMTDREGHIVEIPHDRVTLFGTPASFYRELLRECRLWALAFLQREENASLNHYNRMQYWIGYISRRYERTSAELTHSRFTEIAAFTKRLLLKKISRRSGMVC